MSDYDLEKALKEEITGLIDVHLSLKRRSTALEQQYGEIEHEHNSVKKLLGFAAVLLDHKRQQLDRLLQLKQGKSS